MFHNLFSRYRENRVATISLYIFLGLFTLSLFAEFIANEKPIAVKFEEKFYFPIFEKTYETQFGGDFETETDFKDIYISDKIEKNGWILWTPVRYSSNTINYELPEPAPSPPSAENILGTDDQGRDIFARLLYGLRTSLLFGLLLTAGSVAIAVLIGGVQGYFGGNIDLIGQRAIEIWSGLPTLFLIIILSHFVTPNFWWLISISLLFSWIGLASLVRAEFLRVRNFEFISATKLIGGGDFYIIFRHMLPNGFISTLTYIPFTVVNGVVLLTSLDFLGFGLPVESASLGEMLAQAKNNLNAPWIGISITVTLTVTLLTLVFIGEGFRDLFDSRKDVRGVLS
jgi:microcin C transport system permease protein